MSGPAPGTAVPYPPLPVAIGNRQGPRGWSPMLATVRDGEREVHQVIDWTGGQESKPPVGGYIGRTGIVAGIGDAVDLRGPQGNPDSPYIAAAPVGGHRVVAVEADGRVRHADPTNADDFFRVAGISTHAAAADAAVAVRTDGVLNFEGWTWTPGLPVFAAAGGLITQSPLGVGALIQIGAALSATSIYVRIERAIFLN